MARRFTAIRLSGGQSHEHIVHLWYVDQATGLSSDDTRAHLVSWVEGGGKAYVEDRYGNRADVGVVTPTVGAKYLRTYADGKWTDNLLALPRR
ncbi:DUF3892 domain-containing protein [Kibdelosporangium lantanae]|uniref:DUF3892 domain-containing protein n=1 Tax=Kibdelosporangium lantanae TaxID=1497396 RepID=A0ABW3M0V6_9PSEU